MKKIFFFPFLLLATAFVHQSCGPVDNSEEIAESDSIADARLVMFRDSMMMACMSDVMAAARLRADSMMQFAMRTPGAKAPSKPKAPPPPKSSGKLSEKLDQDNEKLKDKLNASDTSKKKSGKLKDKLNTEPTPK